MSTSGSTRSSSGVEPTTGPGSSSSTADATGSTTEDPTTGTTAGELDRCDRDDPSLPTVNLPPTATDPEISDGFPHVYVEPEEPVGLLLVFFPGTSGPPAGYRKVLQNAAAGGYHALGLAYRNELAVNDLCAINEPGCHADVRTEILTGVDTSDKIEVGPADSIENRLVKAVTHLGWEQYTGGELPRWDLIALAGHSQGAGHAAFIARAHEVHRAVLFSGTEPADWTQEATVTPLERYFGFVHADDPQYVGMTASWENLGLLGALVDVDVTPWPYGDSHRLESYLPVPAESAHGAPVTDPHTPDDGDGLPIYRDVWCRVLGP